MAKKFAFDTLTTRLSSSMMVSGWILILIGFLSPPSCKGSTSRFRPSGRGRGSPPCSRSRDRGRAPSCRTRRPLSLRSARRGSYALLHLDGLGLVEPNLPRVAARATLVPLEAVGTRTRLALLADEPCVAHYFTSSPSCFRTSRRSTS